MRKWNLPLIVSFCVALGCTKATIELPTRERESLVHGRKGSNTSDVVIVPTGQDHCQAKVGQVVHFPFGSWVLPPGPPPWTTKGIDSLKVEVNGSPVPKPEVFSPEAKPGSAYGELVYVFRPKSRGTYRVKVTPVYEQPEEKEARICIVEVSD